jgi:hypothetical protein
MRTIWHDWIKAHHGNLGHRLQRIQLIHLHTESVLTNEPNKAPARVYPNDDGWPMVPDPEVWDMGMVEQKVLMCRYFTITSGTCLKYKRKDIIEL